MRPVRPLSAGDVWNHWQRVEGHSSPDFRSDIRNSLPPDLTVSLFVPGGICTFAAEGRAPDLCLDGGGGR